MKVKLKFLVLCAALVSVAFSSVAFFCVRSNAYFQSKIDSAYSFDDPENQSGLWHDSALSKHFSFTNDYNKYVDEMGLHLNNSAITCDNVAGFMQGDGFGVEIYLDSFTKTSASDKISNIFSLWNGNYVKFAIGVDPAGKLAFWIKQD